MNARCPRCDKMLALPNDSEGKDFRCRHCKLVFRVTGQSLLPHADSSRSLAPSPDPAAVESENRFHGHQIFLIVLACVLFGLAVIFVASGTSRERGTSGKQTLLNVGLVMFLIVVVLATVIKFGMDTACPHCRRWWGKTPRGHKLIEKRLAYKTVTRKDEHQGYFVGSHAGAGLAGGTADRKEQVKILRKTFLDFYECPHCGNRWELERVVDSEDFEVD